MITIDVPNLDNATTDPQELYDLAHNLRLLSHYVNLKATAMVCRLNGAIGTALQAERMCDETYKQLPPEWRW